MKMLIKKCLLGIFPWILRNKPNPIWPGEDWVESTRSDFSLGYIFFYIQVVPPKGGEFY